MEHSNSFIYLGLEVRQRKNIENLKPEDQNYGILSVLDEKNNPCKFFIFKSDILQKILELHLNSLQKIDLVYEIVFINNIWNVRLVDINE